MTRRRRWAALIVLITLLSSACGRIADRQRAVDWFWIHDPAHRDQAIAYDWNGLEVGRVTLPAPSDGSRPYWTQSPDGQHLLLSDGTIVDGTGIAGAHVPNNATWADDNRHLCGVENQSGGVIEEHWIATGPGSATVTYDPAFLFEFGLDGSQRRVASSAGPNSHGGVLAKCSIGADRAAIMTTFIGTTQVWGVLRLSDGAQLGVAPALQHPWANFFSDGTLLAGARIDGDISSNEIRRFPTGELMSHFGLGQPAAFAGEDLAAVDIPGEVSPGAFPAETHESQVIDLATGQPIWSSRGRLDEALGDPSGSAIVVFVADPLASTPLEDVWLVGRDGRATKVAAGVPAWWYQGA